MGTTGVTGYLWDGTAAHKCIIVWESGVHKVVDYDDRGAVLYEPALAIWVTPRALAAALSKTHETIGDLALVTLTPKTAAALQTDPRFKKYDHQRYIEKMDPKNAPAILAGITAWLAQRSAKAA